MHWYTQIQPFIYTPLSHSFRLAHRERHNCRARFTSIVGSREAARRRPQLIAAREPPAKHGRTTPKTTVIKRIPLSSMGPQPSMGGGERVRKSLLAEPIGGKRAVNFRVREREKRITSDNSPFFSFFFFARLHPHCSLASSAMTGAHRLSCASPIDGAVARMNGENPCSH